VSRRLLLALVLAFVLVAPPAAIARVRSFHSPSKNIACLYSSHGGPGAFIRCDVHSLGDWAFRLRRHRKPRKIHVTDAAPLGRVLHYGRSRRLGPFTCRSRRTGLTCKSRVSGHGFRLSRQRQKLF
jgi:hypothetical protein